MYRDNIGTVSMKIRQSTDNELNSIAQLWTYKENYKIIIAKQNEVKKCQGESNEQN